MSSPEEEEKKAQTLDNLLEEKIKTKNVEGHNFKWSDHVVGDISEVNIARLCIEADNDAYIALAEENEDNPKNITICLGGWDNTRSGACYIG